MIISVLANDSFSTSTGDGQSSCHFYVMDEMCPANPGNMNICSANFSVFTAD